MQKLLIPAALIAALLLTAISCQADPDLGDPDIRGSVEGLSVSQGDGEIIGFILIEGAVEADTAHDRALVTVTGSTAIYRREAERLVKARFAELQYGAAVEAWFTGPVAESYPVQAAAATIVINSD